jgi:delta-aminolevulinic acid dehydratase/porphobilinogen synthase
MGWLDGTRVMMETLTSHQAGRCRMILTYFRSYQGRCGSVFGFSINA